jgi:hypothetical protein
MEDDREYVRYLLGCVEFLLERLGRGHAMKKVLRFYRGRLREWLKDPGNGVFTEPLVSDYVMRGMVLLSKQPST